MDISKYNSATDSCKMQGGALQAALNRGYLRQSQLVPAIVPVCASSLWRWIKIGKFPQQIKLSANVTVWRTDEVASWIARQGVPA